MEAHNLQDKYDRELWRLRGDLSDLLRMTGVIKITLHRMTVLGLVSLPVTKAQACGLMAVKTHRSKYIPLFGTLPNARLTVCLGRDEHLTFKFRDVNSAGLFVLLFDNYRKLLILEGYVKSPRFLRFSLWEKRKFSTRDSSEYVFLDEIRPSKSGNLGIDIAFHVWRIQKRSRKENA